MCLCAPLCLTCFVGRGFQHIKIMKCNTATSHISIFCCGIYKQTLSLAPREGIITMVVVFYCCDNWKSAKVSGCWWTESAQVYMFSDKKKYIRKISSPLYELMVNKGHEKSKTKHVYLSPSSWVLTEHVNLNLKCSGVCLSKCFSM